MNYILATITEIKLEVQYRLWASQFNNLENYESFGEFIQDAKRHVRDIVENIKYFAKYDY